LSVDHAGRLWAATWDGLDLVDPSRGRFVTYRPSNEPQGQMYLGIAEDAQGILWLATSFSGLHSFDPATGRFKLYRHSSAQEGTLSNNRVNAVYVDRQGQVWAGTQEGLSRLDPATGLKRVSTRGGRADRSGDRLRGAATVDSSSGRRCRD
jgi:ligand-binding sensor domain-containing protein